MLDLIKFVINDLGKKKFSSFLTLFAISLGILTIFVIFLLSAGFSNSLSAEFAKFGTNRLYVTSVTTGLTSGSFTGGLDDGILRLVENRPYVDEVYPYYMNAVQMEYSKDFATNFIIGTKLSEDFFVANNLEIDKGRFAKNTEKYSLIIGSRAATDLFEKDLNVGSNIYFEGVKFKVVGILESIGNPQDDLNVYGPIDTLRDVYGVGDSIGLFDVVLNDGTDIGVAKANLLVFLENRIGKDTIDIRSPIELLDSFTVVLDIIKYTLGGIGVVALIVGALGIVNTMYVIVSEKKKDIGIMKAIGATDFDILFIFVFQAGLFGFMGGLLGIIMAAGVSMVFEVVAKSSGFSFLDVSFDFVAAFALLIFSFMIGVVSGYLPAKQAADTNIIDAIRK